MSEVKRILVMSSVIFTVLTLTFSMTPIPNILAVRLADGEGSDGGVGSSTLPGGSAVDLIVVLGGGAYEGGELSGASTMRMVRGISLLKEGKGKEILFSGSTVLDTTRKVLDTMQSYSGESLPPAAGVDSLPGKARYGEGMGIAPPLTEETLEAGSPHGEGTGEVEPPGPEREMVEAPYSEDPFAPIPDGLLMAEFAETIGVDKGSIHVEVTSTNTFENLVGVKRYMEDHNLNSCTVVTSPTHTYRTMSVIRKLSLPCTTTSAGDYIKSVRNATGRVSLMRSVLWEYGALILYNLKGYI